MRFAILLVVAIPASAAAVDQEKPTDSPDAKTLTRINQAGLVFTGKVARKVTVLGDTATTSHELEFSDVNVLRGNFPAQMKLETPDFDPAKEPKYPKETTWLVATSDFLPKHIVFMAPVNDKLLALTKQVIALPLGWTLDGGQPISPWSALGEKAWPRNMPKGKEPTCARTSRPALMTGDTAEISVVQIIPEPVQPFRNPFGDGKFRITVTNPADKRIAIPTLLSDGKNILWEDSLVIVNVGSGTPCLLAGVGKAGKAQAVGPVELGPKESISTTVDILTASGVFYHPGGARYYYRFCLGEKSVTTFFYYHTDHHEPLRAAALKKAQATPP